MCKHIRNWHDGPLIVMEYASRCETTGLVSLPKSLESLTSRDGGSKQANLTLISPRHTNDLSEGSGV